MWARPFAGRRPEHPGLKPVDVESVGIIELVKIGGQVDHGLSPLTLSNMPPSTCRWRRTPVRTSVPRTSETVPWTSETHRYNAYTGTIGYYNHHRAHRAENPNLNPLQPPRGIQLVSGFQR